MGDHDGLESVITIGWNAHGVTVLEGKRHDASIAPRALTAEQLRPLARSPNYLLLAVGNLTGTCGEVLTTRGAPSGEAWLFSVSISRMNFSASIGVASR